MKKQIRIIILTCFSVFVLSCSFLDNIADLIRDPLKRFVVSPTPVIIQPTPTLKVITPDEDLSPVTNTPTTQVEELSVETPVPTGLNPEGPYVLFSGRAGIWISNPDGSSLTQIFGEIGMLYRIAVAPNGSRIALVTSNDEGIDLFLIELPGGQYEHIARLLTGFSNDITDPVGVASRAIRNYQSLAWQGGDGRKLAFIGAINGPTTDLYLYDTLTHEITQLVESPSQVIHPTWSPDGQFIHYYAVSWVGPFSSAISRYDRMDGVFVVRVEDKAVFAMPAPERNHPNFLGWEDEYHYLACDNDFLYRVDVLNGDKTEVIPSCCYNQISFSPIDGTILLNFTEGCNEQFGEGIFLLPPNADTPNKVSDSPADLIYWVPESNMFFAKPGMFISNEGQTFYMTPRERSGRAAVSIIGNQASYFLEDDLQYVVKVLVSGGEWQTVLNEYVEALIWDPIDGQTLLMVAGTPDEDGRLVVAEFPDFDTKTMGYFDGSIDQAIYVP